MNNESLHQMRKGVRRRTWDTCPAFISIVINVVVLLLGIIPIQAYLPPTVSISSRATPSFRRSPHSFLAVATSPKLSTTREFSRSNDLSLNRAATTSFIRAIQNCTTVAQVQDLFLATDFQPTSYSVNATSWSAFPYFPITVATLCRATKLMAKNEQQLRVANTTLLPNILREIATILVLVQRPAFRSTDAGLRPFSMNTLTDLLLSLEWIALKSKAGPSSMTPLARSLCILMEQQLRLDGKLCLGPYRIWKCFQACYHLGLLQPQVTEQCNQRHSPPDGIVAMFCDRLIKGDVLATLPAKQLAEGLDMVHSLMQQEIWSTSVAEPLLKAFSRRLRKESVRDHATSHELMHALVASRHLVTHIKPQHHDDDASIQQEQHESALYLELKSMVYTITIDLFQMHEKNASFVTFSQLRQVLHILLTFQFHVDDRHDETNKGHSIVDILCEKLCLELSSHETVGLYELSDIIRSLAYAKPPLQRKQPELFYRCGKSLIDLFHHGHACADTAVTNQPKLFNALLRGTVLMHKNNHTVLEPFLAACRIAYVDEEFLATSSSAELSNFAWFLSMAHARGSDHTDALIALAQRILHESVVDTLTVKQAVCCIKAFVTLSFGEEEEENAEFGSLHNVVINLIEGLAGHLLSNQLTAAEASSALYAYARSNYLQDMGIFDHLTNVMVAQLSRASTRQVATSLWACGRMMRFEKGHDDVTYEAHEPPYWRNAQSFLRHLAERSELLNCADTSQALWAIGHLGAAEVNLVDPLLDRAVLLANQLSAQESANIIWGVSKVLEGSPISFTKQNQIAQLTRTILSLDPNPQEISNVMYALALLEMADETTFLRLAQKMMKQMNQAEAHAISNALWAFQTSELPPPRQLLDMWAAPKLGWIKVPPSPVNSPTTA